MKRNIVLLGAAALLAILYFGCSDMGSNPPQQVSFKAEIQPILNSNCALSFCHGSPTPPNNLNLTTYNGVLTSGIHAPVVVPFQPDSSYLVWKLRGTAPEGTQMPPPGNPAPTSADTSQIVQWIAQGALDN